MVAFAGPLTAGNITEPASAVPLDLDANGYLEEEFLARGTAQSYALAGEAGSDGIWPAQTSDSAPYCTRIVVRRPADAARFSGTVLVEWLNVSSGFDADPDWAYLHDEVYRGGHAYAGVSVQAVGVVGGPGLLGFPDTPNGGLRASDKARYGALDHPGDQYAFDIFGQIGQALAGDAGPVAVLGGLRPARVLAIGESQSAIYLTSYINAIHPIAPAFDGFFVHSRGATGAPLSGAGIDRQLVVTEGVQIRSDSPTPVMVLQTESDVLPPLGFGLVRQPDSEVFRLWEVAGTSHADAYLIGAAAELLGFDWPINEGPHRFVAQAALRAFHVWVSEGTAPPLATRIELATKQPLAIARDEHGNALGGVRTPALDVPVATLSGQAPPGSSGAGWLVGFTTPLDTPVLTQLYGTTARYLQSYTTSLDEAIASGFVLPEHRDELLADAARVAFPAG